MRFLSHLLVLVIASAILPLSLHAASDAAITEQTLLGSERYWPYHVALVTPLRTLKVGTTGVLIRVEPHGVARIDFGRAGLFEAPVGATDLVERANRVRRGEATKKAPNFVLAVAPRLVDTAAEPPRGYSFERAAQQRGFLAVFADPGSKDFPELVKSLTPLAERKGVLTILFPQGKHQDPEVYEKLRALEWRVPFVYSHLTEPYTRSLLPEPAPRPTLQLQTPEGRVLFQSGWAPGVVPKLSAAIDAALGQPS